MSTAIAADRRLRIGPRSAGLLLTAAEFDHAVQVPTQRVLVLHVLTHE